LNRLNVTVIYAIAAVILSFGCSSREVTGETWLVVAGEDTIPVAEIGQIWSDMTEENKDLFTSKDNPVGEFVVAVARRYILEQELTANGYLSNTVLNARRDAWLRYLTIERAYQYYTDKFASEVLEEDIDFYVEHLGKTVWYTTNPGTPEEEGFGPDHLPELPFDLALMLDTMETGDTGLDMSGSPVRLDSTVITDSALVAETLADTVASRGFAASRLAQGRSRRWLNNIQDTVIEDHSVVIDSAAAAGLLAYYADEAELQADEIVLHSDLGDWTAQDMVDFTDYLSSRMFTQPSSQEWQDYFFENLVTHSVLLDLFETDAPGLIDSLADEADAYLFELASESIYENIVSSSVSVTEDDIQEQFSSLSEVPTVEEMRIFRMALLPQDRLLEYKEALSVAALEEFISGLESYSRLSAGQADPQVTHPLRIAEVPGGYGEQLFQISPDDPSWVDPLIIDENTGYLLCRLVEIVPARPAMLEDIRYDMEMAARGRLEEEATLLWMQQLEEIHGLDINEEALDCLPADLGLWSAL